MSTSESSAQILRDKQLLFFHLALYIGAFPTHFTINIINVALPALIQSFPGQEAYVKWIVIGYALTVSITLPLMGSLANRLGYRFLHNTGYILFTISSIVIAIFPNLIILLIFRIIQAIGVAMFASTNLALITLHTPKEQRSRAIGFFSSVVALGTMSGPVAGGFILQWLGWEWLFWANIPFALLALYLSFQYVPRSTILNKTQPLDGLGIFLFASTIGTFVYTLSFAGDWGWLSNKTGCFILLLIISFFLFWLWEKKQSLPFLPYHLFRSSIITICSLIIISCFLVANAALVTMPFYLSEISHLPAYQIGYMMLIYPVIIVFAGPIAGALSDQYGPKRFIAIGLALIFVSSFMILLLKGQLSLFHIALALTLFGTGVGMASAPTNHLILKNTPKEFVGVISSLIALLRNIGILLGSTIGLVFITHNHSIPSGMSFIFAICSCISLVCFLGIGFASWQTRRALTKSV